MQMGMFFFFLSMSETLKMKNRNSSTFWKQTKNRIVTLFPKVTDWFNVTNGGVRLIVMTPAGKNPPNPVSLGVWRFNLGETMCAQSVLLRMDNPSETGWRWVTSYLWLVVCLPWSEPKLSLHRLTERDINKNLVYYWTSTLKHDVSNTKVMGLISRNILIKSECALSQFE